MPITSEQSAAIRSIFEDAEKVAGNKVDMKKFAARFEAGYREARKAYILDTIPDIGFFSQSSQQLALKKADAPLQELKDLHRLVARDTFDPDTFIAVLNEFSNSNDESLRKAAETFAAKFVNPQLKTVHKGKPLGESGIGII